VQACSQTRSTSSSASTPTATATPWPSGRPGAEPLLAAAEFSAEAAGHAGALQVAARHPGRRASAVEGTGASGAGLARSLAAQGERVIEIDRPERRGERTGPRARRSMPPAPRAPPSPAGARPARAPVASARPCACCR
jgi:hypothetical protein